MATPTELLRLVVDPTRLAVLGASVSGPIDVEALATALEEDRARVVRAVGVLRQAGLLDESMRLVRSELIRIAADLPQDEPAADGIVEGPWSVEEADVLRRFFTGGRLQSIPAPRGKRLIVLERLVQQFEPGVRYPEREVNAVLQVFHEDYATLRRYLVDEGLLTRAEGVYWRTGGRYAVEPGEAARP